MSVTVEDDDFGDTMNEFIDAVRFEIRSVNVSERYQSMQRQGEHRVGTLGISYRIQCLSGFYGASCSQQNCTSGSTGERN